MYPLQNTKAFRHFAKHLFLAGRVYVERKKAKNDVYSQLQRMKKSIIRMSLGYTDIDKLQKKIENLVNWERRYAKFFKPEDNETKELKDEIKALEQELRNEKEEKLRIISENNERIQQLTESLNNVKNKTNELFIDGAKRRQRHIELDKKIRERVKFHSYGS